MNREPAPIPHASQAIEDLLKESSIDTHPQNWLLSYLDVFMLIVMLMITLSALTEINANQVIQTSEQSNHHDASGTLTIVERQPEPQKVSKEDKKPVQPVSESVENSIEPQKETATETTTRNQIDISEHVQQVAIISTPLESAATNIDPDVEQKIEITVEQQADQTGHAEKLETTTESQEQERQPDTQEQLQLPDSKTIVSKSDVDNKQTITTVEQEPAGTTETTEQQVQVAVPAAVAKQYHNDVQRQKQLSEKLAELHLDELISLEVKQGFAQLQIQDNILFDTAKAELTEQGKSLLQRLLPLLHQSIGLIFIEGHTDDRPIATDQFPSNWELSSARATSVLRFLVSQQLAKNRLRAVSYADTMAIADNETEAGRSQNRRVSILLRIPDDEL